MFLIEYLKTNREQLLQTYALAPDSNENGISLHASDRFMPCFARMLAQKTTFGIQISASLFFLRCTCFIWSQQRCVKGEKREPDVAWIRKLCSARKSSNGNLIVERKKNKEKRIIHNLIHYENGTMELIRSEGRALVKFVSFRFWSLEISSKILNQNT